MSRNTLMLIIVALVVVVAIVGYQLYQEENQAELEVEVGNGGISVQTN